MFICSLRNLVPNNQTLKALQKFAQLNYTRKLMLKDLPQSKKLMYLPILFIICLRCSLKENVTKVKITLIMYIF